MTRFTTCRKCRPPLLQRTEKETRWVLCQSANDRSLAELHYSAAGLPTARERVLVFREQVSAAALISWATLIVCACVRCGARFDSRRQYRHLTHPRSTPSPTALYIPEHPPHLLAVTRASDCGTIKAIHQTILWRTSTDNSSLSMRTRVEGHGGIRNRAPRGQKCAGRERDTPEITFIWMLLLQQMTVHFRRGNNNYHSSMVADLHFEFFPPLWRWSRSDYRLNVIWILFSVSLWYERSVTKIKKPNGAATEIVRLQDDDVGTAVILCQMSLLTVQRRRKIHCKSSGKSRLLYYKNIKLKTRNN